MNCPRCGSPNTRNVSSYLWLDGVTVTRHRLCRAEGCWLRFKTRERPVPSEDYFLPRSKGRRAPQRLLRG